MLKQRRTFLNASEKPVLPISMFYFACLVNVKFQFRKPLLQKSCSIVSAIKLEKILSKFMIPIALLENSSNTFDIDFEHSECHLQNHTHLANRIK